MTATFAVLIVANLAAWAVVLYMGWRIKKDY